MFVTRPTPIVNQVDEILRERIRRGTYPPGGRLPSESELSQTFGVSRATLRTVLAKLAAEGIILRKQGDGTYVNQRLQDVNTHLGGLLDYVCLIESSGHEASIQALKMERRIATEQEKQALAIEAGDEVLAMVRLFFADRKPVILATNVIFVSFLNEDIEKIDGSLPIRVVLDRYCHQKTAYSITDIQAGLASAEVARVLNSEPSTPLLKIKSTFYNKDNHPLVFGVSDYDDRALKLRFIQTWG